MVQTVRTGPQQTGGKDMAENDHSPGRQAILRGLIIGGSLGMIAGWFGIDPARAFFLGTACGLLAGLTRLLADRRKK